MDITGLPAGEYTLRAELNPPSKFGGNETRGFLESNYANNVVFVPMTIKDTEGCKEGSPFKGELIPFAWTDPETNKHKRVSIKRDKSVEVELPWNIKFWCREHNTVYLNEHGFLSFTKDQGKYTRRNLAFPLPNTMAVFWDNWRVDNDVGGLWWKVKGKEGSRQFIATWSNVVHKKREGQNPNHRVSFQIVLHEEDDSVEYRYKNTKTSVKSVSRGRSSTIGLAGSKPTDGEV